VRVARHLRRAAHGRRGDTEVNHDDPQGHAWDHLLEQRRNAPELRSLDGLEHDLRRRDVDTDGATLLAARRLHHDALVALEEGLALRLGTRLELLRHAEPCVLQHPIGHPLVIAAAHRDGARELAQRLAAHDVTPAEAEGEIAELRVEDVHTDAAALSLARDDPRVRVELCRHLAEKQRLVDLASSATK